MSFDRDDPPVRLGLEPVPGLDLAESRIAPARSAASSASSVGDVASEWLGAEVVPGSVRARLIDCSI